MRVLTDALLSILIGAILFGFADDSKTDEPPVKPETLTLCGETFKLELAADSEARAKGLSGREKLEDDGGMLFVFPKPAVLSFWMADCLIDIDILFLDSRGRIVRTHEMKKEPPQREGESRAAYERRLRSYSSGRSAQFAVELTAGTIKRLEIRPGQTIPLETDRLKRIAR